MYTTSKHRETRQPTIVNGTAGYSDGDLFEDLSDPEELESWTMEELDDFLPSQDILVMDEFEVPWRQIDSFAQMYGLVD